MMDMEMMDMEVIFWLGAVIVLLIIEIITLGLTTIWFAGGALAACIAAWLGAGLVAQIILFLTVSVLLLISTRPFAVRYLSRYRVKTNVESLAGREAVVLQAIDNLHPSGQIRLNGVEWTARAENNREKIEEGALVEIVRIEGVKAIVRRKEG